MKHCQTLLMILTVIYILNFCCLTAHVFRMTIYDRQRTAKPFQVSNYIGETGTELSLRFNNHKQPIRVNGNNFTLTGHFNHYVDNDRCVLLACSLKNKIAENRS